MPIPDAPREEEGVRYLNGGTLREEEEGSAETIGSGRRRSRSYFSWVFATRMSTLARGFVKRWLREEEEPPLRIRDLREEEEAFALASDMDHRDPVVGIFAAEPSGRRRRVPPIPKAQGGGGAFGN
ncbi:hypothetical protein BFP70_07880 [Thioclava sp. SK-1]|uniref:hypothetical protein n=1 Tax=Thioclava sp. SK-1 TaxID=1889770 RepID=UPI0008250BD4|nr:hypothetical protein [Thioclava sp. SK-1]OCX66029.1 hypothetical protein BFP70_07880 [Thioclava sp. SK-1]